MDRRELFRLIGGAGLATAGIIPRRIWAASPSRSWSVAETPIFALRNAGCSCCVGWADHLRENGFEVHLHDSPDLQAVKRRLGVPEDLQGCHTAVVEGYLVEGHVPADHIRRMLEEQPQLAGIAVAGMPIGSPGMEGPNPQPFDVVAFGAAGDADRHVFGTVTPSE